MHLRVLCDILVITSKAKNDKGELISMLDEKDLQAIQAILQNGQS